MGMLGNVLIWSLSFWVLNLMNELINDLFLCFYLFIFNFDEKH